jgi:hypothetical protein
MRKVELNSFDPFNHGVWEKSATSEKLDKEEFLSWHSKLIITKFCEFGETFTEDQIASMTLIDSGNYDGWFANEISKNMMLKMWLRPNRTN